MPMPNRRNARSVRQSRRHAVRNGAHWFGFAAAALLLAVGPARANPQGGQVTGGSATIANSSPLQVDIVQSTDRAVIDWKSFNIAVASAPSSTSPPAARGP